MPDLLTDKPAQLSIAVISPPGDSDAATSENHWARSSLFPWTLEVSSSFLLPHSPATQSGVQQLTAQKLIRSNVGERKVCFILDAGNQGGEQTSVQRLPPPTDIQGQELSQAKGVGNIWKQHSQL